MIAESGHAEPLAGTLQEAVHMIQERQSAVITPFSQTAG